MKKWLALILAAMMALAVLGGAFADAEDDAYARLEEVGVYDGEPITLNVYSQLANYSGLQGHWSADLLLDKYNVRINIIPDSDGTYATRMESGNLGDIVVWGADGDQYQAAVAQGLLLDWEEDGLVEEYAPYIWENYQTALEANRAKNSDGKIHGFGHNVALKAGSHENFFYTWDIRWDLYQQLGCPAVKDLNAMIDLFKQMKELCPTDENGNETYAVSIWPDWDGNMVMYVKALATAYFGWDEFELGLINTENGQFQGCLEPDGLYIQCLKFFNQLYREGLLDPNSASQTYSTMGEKVKAGGTFWSIFNYAGSAIYNTAEHLDAGKYMYTMVPDEATPISYGLSLTGGNRIWSVGADAEYPELCLAIIDYLATPEGSLTMWYGPRGLMWDYNEQGGLYFTELGKTCNQDSKHDLSGVEWVSPYTGKSYTLSGNFNDGCIQINNTTLARDMLAPDSKLGEAFNKDTWVSEQAASAYAIQEDWRNWSGVSLVDPYFEKVNNYTVMPDLPYSESVRDDTLEVKWGQVTKAITTNSWRAIYAKADGEFDMHIRNMRTQCDSYGYAECIEWSRGEAAVKWQLQQEQAALAE